MSSLVSVIMPYYKKKSFYLKSINSVLKQTYKNLEIIIIYDDQNKDELDFIKNCINIDSRVKIIFNETNKGVAYSRNKAISIAQGEYIAFLDCDDYWEDNKTELQLNFMEDNGYEFSFTTYKVVDSDDKIIGQIKANKVLGYNELLKSCDIGLSSVILKRKLLENMKFPILTTKEDFVLWLNLLKNSVELKGLDKVLMFWRQTSHSLSSSILARLMITST